MAQTATVTKVPSKWIKCISGSGTVRGVALDATEAVRSLALAHKCSPKATQGLGEVAVSALLLSSYCKNGERINLNIRGSGVYNQAFVDARPDGTFRGYVSERKVSYSPEGFGPWGEGLMAVLKTRDADGEQPYIGTVPLVTGHLAKDITFYWLQSEQVPSSVGLAVKVDENGIVFAGGFLVQAMPGATAEEISQIDTQIQTYSDYAKDFLDHQNPTQVLGRIFGDSTFVLLEERPLAIKCDCSMQRIERALALIGADEVESMIKEDGKATVHCDFCAKDYLVERAVLEKILKNAQSD